MTVNGADYPLPSERPEPSVDELFRASPPVASADDLARDGVFDDGELEEFLADLASMRRADLG